MHDLAVITVPQPSSQKHNSFTSHVEMINRSEYQTTQKTHVKGRGWAKCRERRIKGEAAEKGKGKVRRRREKSETRLKMLREAVAGAGRDHRCFNVLISMPGLLPPRSVSSPPSFSSSSCFWRSLERPCSACVDAITSGGARTGVGPLGNGNVVPKGKHVATNISLQTTALEIIHHVPWPPRTHCWSADVTCYSEHRRRFVLTLAPTQRPNMSGCYLEKAVHRVLATQVMNRSRLIRPRR